MKLRNKTIIWLSLAITGIALVAAACGGGDDDSGENATFSGLPVTCGTMNDDSYRFVTTIQYKVDAAPTPTPAGVAPGPPPAEFTQKVEGDVESADSYQAASSFVDQYTNTTTDVVRTGGKYWVRNASGWYANPDTEVPYHAISLCNSLAPDVDPTAVSHTSEAVNGIASERFDYTDWPTTWADRSPDWGAGSDVGALIETYTGSIWIATNGNYISKMHLVGQGAYPDGTVLHIDISYEIKDRGAKIKIAPPV